jgi:hypothetical protein
MIQTVECDNKTSFRLNQTSDEQNKWFSSYLTENKLTLLYKGQQVNAV